MRIAEPANRDPTEHMVRAITTARSSRHKILVHTFELPEYIHVTASQKVNLVPLTCMQTDNIGGTAYSLWATYMASFMSNGGSGKPD